MCASRIAYSVVSAFFPASPVAKDNEGLADACVQALFQITHDNELLKPFFERLKSKVGEERVNGIVAFRFLKLKKAPPEVVAALDDASPDVTSWAALVLGEIGDANTEKVYGCKRREKGDVGPSILTPSWLWKPSEIRRRIRSGGC